MFSHLALPRAIFPHCVRVYSIVLLAVSWSIAGRAEESTQSQGLAGLRLARFDIDATPPVGSMMAYDRVIRVEELGLRCRGIVLLGRQEPIVLCAVDWIGIGNEAHDRFREVLARAAGTSMQRVAVHTLHQHDAPRSDFTAERLLIEAGVSDLGGHDNAFAREVLNHLNEAVQVAVENATPVTHYGFATAIVEQVASNRRIKDESGKVRATRYTACRDPQLRAEPEGVIDPELSLLTFWNQSTPVAAISYYAVHPQSYYRTGVPSPDFPGIARWMRSQDLPNVLHLHFNGAGGNLGAGKYNDGSPPNRLILAQRMASAMHQAYMETEKQPLSPEDIGWSVAPVRLPPGEHLQEETMRADLQNWKTGQFVARPDKLGFLLRYKTGHEIELSCFRVADARILHLPGELFVEYQLAAKALRPDLHVAMAAYGDYGTGYIGTAAAYDEGGYETSARASNVDARAEAILMAGISELLEVKE